MAADPRLLSFRDVPLLFSCNGDELVGIASVPRDLASTTGVLVVVGGPQYRVGSHRQFVLLARDLAARGIACMRFDYRGMGDASGNSRAFDDVGDDIAAAVDAFLARVPALRAVVLWGLCDGASAACFYAPRDARVRGVILLNPWVRTSAGEARTLLAHHYRAKLIDPRFWRRLGRGDVRVGSAVRSALGAMRRAAFPGAASQADAPLPQRMADGVMARGIPFALGLSGRDYVALEFAQLLEGDAAWSGLVQDPRCVEVARWPHADHTFSRAEWRDAVANASHRWLLALDRMPMEA
jgi:exosortase A-associated hydrolase 1